MSRFAGRGRTRAAILETGSENATPGCRPNLARCRSARRRKDVSGGAAEPGSPRVRVRTESGRGLAPDGIAGKLHRATAGGGRAGWKRGVPPESIRGRELVAAIRAGGARAMDPRRGTG